MLGALGIRRLTPRWCRGKTPDVLFPKCPDVKPGLRSFGNRRDRQTGFVGGVGEGIYLWAGKTTCPRKRGHGTRPNPSLRPSLQQAHAGVGQADIVVFGIVGVHGVRGNGFLPRGIFPMCYSRSASGTGGTKKLARE